MENKRRIIDQLWLKLLVGVLIVCGVLIILGYAYYRDTSCTGDIFSCFEFEVIMLGGGILAISLPIIIAMFFWELYKKIKEKKEERELQNMYK